MVPVLPACRCQTYVTGSRVFPLVEWEKCLMCVSGELECGQWPSSQNQGKTLGPCLGHLHIVSLLR